MRVEGRKKEVSGVEKGHGVYREPLIDRMGNPSENRCTEKGRE